MVHSKMMKTTKRAVVDTTGQRKEPSSFSQDCQIVEMATDGALTNSRTYEELTNTSLFFVEISITE